LTDAMMQWAASRKINCADRAQSSFGEHAQHLRIRHLGPRLLLGLPKDKTPLAITLKLNGYGFI
jgi:hypothetical protein